MRTDWIWDQVWGEGWAIRRPLFSIETPVEEGGAVIWALMGLGCWVV